MKELNKYADALVTYRKQGGLPQGEVKEALADIYEELRPDHPEWGVSKINRGCPSCISDMMKSLCAHWEASLKYEKFEGIPVEAALIDEEEVSPEVAEAIKGVEVLNRVYDPPKEFIEDYHNLSWGQLKSFATNNGVNTRGKKKIDILAELDELFK